MSRLEDSPRPRFCDPRIQMTDPIVKTEPLALYRLLSGKAHGTIRRDDATSGGIALKMLTPHSGSSEAALTIRSMMLGMIMITKLSSAICSAILVTCICQRKNEMIE